MADNCPHCGNSQDMPYGTNGRKCNHCHYVLEEDVESQKKKEGEKK